MFISLPTLTDSPMVNTLPQQDIIEGRDLFVTCTATPGNPVSTTFYWTKIDNPGFKQNGTTLQLSNIQRTSAGTYKCRAENNYSNGERGTHNQSMIINVLCELFMYITLYVIILKNYWCVFDFQQNVIAKIPFSMDFIFYWLIFILITDPPLVNSLSNRNIIEGRNLSVTCTATPGHPSSTVMYWTKVDNPGFRQNGATLYLYTIQRSNSGTYKCTGENNYFNGKRGTHSQTMVVNVLCMYLVYNYTIQKSIISRLSDRMRITIVTCYKINNWLVVIIIINKIFLYFNTVSVRNVILWFFWWGESLLNSMSLPSPLSFSLVINQKSYKTITID